MSYIAQGTPEWLELRKKHIGASDAAVVLGISPWKTRYQLWQEKLGLYEVHENEAMRRGKDLEAEAREYYSGLLDEYFVDDVKTKGIFLASLDGINLDKTQAIEIKCPNIKRVHEFSQSPSVPRHYYAQLQQQMYVYDLDCIYYAEYHPDLKVQPHCVFIDDNFIENYVTHAKAFWYLVESKTPPEMCEDDYVVRDDEDWKALCWELKRVKKEIDSLKNDEAYYRDLLIDKSDCINSKGCGVTVSKSLRSGGIDYESMPEDLKDEVDKYRKKQTEFWTIRIDKDG